MAVQKSSVTLKIVSKVFLTSFFLFSIFINSQIFAQTNEDCLGCHNDETLNMDRNGKKVSLFADTKVLQASPHKKLQCIACHAGFDAGNIPHKENIQPVNCLSCHKNVKAKHSFHPQMMKSGANSMGSDVNCKGCHGTHDVKKPKINVGTGGGVSCGKCHGTQTKDYALSAHFEVKGDGISKSPECLSCHSQAITKKSFPKDPLKMKLAQDKLCLTCHLDDPQVRSRFSFNKGFIKAYESSVHGKALQNGNGRAAGCVDCHGSHLVQSSSDPNSSVAKMNIPQTCGKCHVEIVKKYNESVHGIAVAKGSKEAPVCTDCHGEHNILKHTDPNSPVAFQNVSEKVCSPCHSSVALTEKYGLSANRFQTFKDTYHGLALRGGSVAVANCGSCHGIHDIKSSKDPSSSINKANLAKTCGKCHPGANQNFAVGTIHVTLAKKDEPVLYWISLTYIILLIATLGGMFLHNLIDFLKKAKLKKMRQRGLIKHEYHGHSLYLRMTLVERIQHVSLMVSFFTLVLTGFMLRFPEAWWVVYLRNIFPHIFEFRSYLHRIAAVVMVMAGFYHIYYVSFTARGRQLIFDLLPRLQDAKDAIGMMKYNLGFSKEKPQLDRFSYVEKSEYWALIWGTIVMSVTGVVMWFDNTFIGLFTKLGWDIARTIHYYEAWLAFLSIVIWHFYFVIFNPDIYPMNIAWIKGTLTEEEMAEEHPKELERLKGKDEPAKIKE